jgi:hypothetical protein
MVRFFTGDVIFPRAPIESLDEAPQSRRSNFPAQLFAACAIAYLKNATQAKPTL